MYEPVKLDDAGHADQLKWARTRRAQGKLPEQRHVFDTCRLEEGTRVEHVREAA